MKTLLILVLVLLGAGSPRAQSISYAVPKDYRATVSPADYRRIVDLAVAAVAPRFQIKQVRDGTIVLADHQAVQALNLHNLLATCAAAPDKAQWPSLVQDHFDKLFATLRRQATLDVQNFDTVAHYLSLRIYPAATVAQRGGAAAFVTRPDLDGTLTMLMLDLPGAFTPVPQPLFAAWHKTPGEVFQLAQRNVNQQPVTKVTKTFDVNGHSIEMSFLGNEDYAASYALDLAANSPELLGQWGAVVAIPNKGLVDMCKVGPDRPFDFVQFIQRTRSLVQQSFEQHQQPVSDRYFWYYQGRFTPITVTTGSQGEAVVVAPIQLGELMAARK